MKTRQALKHSYQSKKDCGRKTQGNDNRKGINAICSPKDMHGGSEKNVGHTYLLPFVATGI